ncbi:hypothetical protein V1478_017456 [Vespula squamosa]|uniref:Uncharacterized protein n=1 Tax=Vespula squamosa TaxID=30214 RepID=A0ABD1ZZH2_VESSQ
MITSSGRGSSEKYFGPRANVESKHSSSIRKEQEQEEKEKKSTLDQWALLVSSSSINDFNFLRSTMATINAQLRFLFQRGLPSFYDVQRFLESPRKSFPRSMHTVYSHGDQHNSEQRLPVTLSFLIRTISTFSVSSVPDIYDHQTCVYGHHLRLASRTFAENDIQIIWIAVRSSESVKVIKREQPDSISHLLHA